MSWKRRINRLSWDWWKR